MSAHWEDCYEIHPACALARLRILEQRVKDLERVKVETVHLPRPTWAAPIADEPPCALPGDHNNGGV